MKKAEDKGICVESGVWLSFLVFATIGFNRDSGVHRLTWADASSTLLTSVFQTDGSS